MHRVELKVGWDTIKSAMMRGFLMHRVELKVLLSPGPHLQTP
jgi:hypothetical protein